MQDMQCGVCEEVETEEEREDIRRRKRAVELTREICEYGFEVRQRMFERLDEKMGYGKKSGSSKL